MKFDIEKTDKGFQMTVRNTDPYFDGTTVCFSLEYGKNPRMFTKSYGREPEFYGEGAKISEAAQGAALQFLAESRDLTATGGEKIPNAVNDWARQVFEKATEMIRAAMASIAASDKHFPTFTIGSEGGDITFQLFPTQGLDRKPESIRDIEGYLAAGSNEVISSGGNNIYAYAADIIDFKHLEEQKNSSIQSLQNFFEKKILPIMDIPYSERTPEQQDAWGTFSDWYKDLYNHRPRDGKNLCYETYQLKKSREEAIGDFSFEKNMLNEEFKNVSQIVEFLNRDSSSDMDGEYELLVAETAAFFNIDRDDVFVPEVLNFLECSRPDDYHKLVQYVMGEQEEDKPKPAGKEIE